MVLKAKRQTLITFYYIYVLVGLSKVIIDPLIPIISKKIDVGFDKIGIALLIGSIITMLSNIISGRLSDRFDIKKLIFLGLIFLFVGFTLFGIYLNYIILIIVIILLRVGFGTVDTTLHSFSTKIYKKDISKIFLNLEIGWYTGAFLGLFTISLVLYFDFFISYLFFIIAFTYALSIIIFYRFCPKKKIKKDKLLLKDRGFSWKKILYFLKDSTVVISSFLLFFYMGSIMGLSTWMTTYFLSFGLKVAYSSSVLTLYWLFSIIGMIIIYKIISKIKEIIILFVGCLLGNLCLVLFSFIPNVFIKIVALAFQAIFYSGIFPLTTAITSQRDQKNSGAILGFMIAFAFAGSIVFQPIYGYVAEYLIKSYIAFISLGGAFIGLLFTFILFKIVCKKSFRNNIKY